MVLELPSQLENALATLAGERGVSPESLALSALKREFLTSPTIIPTDDWERKLFSAAIDCGVSPPASALSSDGLYD